MEIVVIISANTEWKAVKALFPDSEVIPTPYGEAMDVKLETPALGGVEGRNLKLFHSGWGKIASAGSIQYAIDRYQPDLIVNLGTCGGFEGVVNQGDLILVEGTFVYDINELMSDADVSTYYASSLDLGWLANPLPYLARRGLIASADSDLPPEKISFLRSKGAIAADWESASLAWVAGKNNARLLILRMVSDLVSEQGGEAYCDIEVYKERTRDIMKQLFEQLPAWLDAIQIT